MRFLKSVTLFFLASSLLLAQFGLMPEAKQQFLDNSGRPLAGGCLVSYAAGTTTPQPTYTDSSGTASNTNPVILDGGGRANVWLNTALSYKLILTAAPLSGMCTFSNLGSQVWSVDGVSATAGGSGAGTFLPLAGGTMTGTILAGTSNTIDLGSVTASWRNLYLGSGLYLGGTLAINGTRDATLHNVTVTGTCTGCGASGTFLPLAGGTITGDILVNPTDVVSLGSNTAEIKKVWVKDVNISGSCTGAGCGGGGSFLPLSGGTMSGNIAADNPGTLVIGSKPTPFGGGFFLSNLSSRKFEVFDSSAADLTGPAMNLQSTIFMAGPILHDAVLDINDSANLFMLSLRRVVNGTTTSSAIFDMDLEPSTPGGKSIGIHQPWANLFLSNSLEMNGQVVLDTNRNGTFHDVTITGTCSGCPGAGSGAFLPITGGTMTGNILANAANTLALGSKGTPFGGGFFMGNLSSRKFEIYDSSAADLTGAFMSISGTLTFVGPAPNNIWIDFNDTANLPILELQSYVNGTGQRLIKTSADIDPAVASTYRMGARNPFLSLNLGQGGGSGLFFPTSATAVIDGNRDARVRNLTIEGSCSGCGGGGGGVSSVTAGTGPVTVSPTTGAVVVSCPTCGSLTQNNVWSGPNQFTTNPVIANQFVLTPGPSSGFWAQSTGTTGVDSNGNGYLNTVNIGSRQLSPITVINSSAVFIGNGVNVGTNGISAGGYSISGTSVIDINRDTHVRNLTIDATCVGCVCPNCGLLSASQTWTGNNSFSAVTTINNRLLSDTFEIGVTNRGIGANGQGYFQAINVGTFTGATPVIDSGGVFVGNGVNVNFGIQATGYNVTGGFTGQTAILAGLSCGSLHFNGGIFTGCF